MDPREEDLRRRVELDLVIWVHRDRHLEERGLDLEVERDWDSGGSDWEGPREGSDCTRSIGEDVVGQGDSLFGGEHRRLERKRVGLVGFRGDGSVVGSFLGEESGDSVEGEGRRSEGGGGGVGSSRDG